MAGGGNDQCTQVQTNVAYTADSSKYLLLVHGWNMSPDDKLYFTQTAFKRLWCRATTAAFGLFDWPTLYGLRSGLQLGTISTPRGTIHHYDDSEMIAWLSADTIEEPDGNTQHFRFSSECGRTAWAMSSPARRCESTTRGQQVKAYIASQAASAAWPTANRPRHGFFSWYLSELVTAKHPAIVYYWGSGDASTTNQPYLISNPGKVGNMCN